MTTDNRHAALRTELSQFVIGSSRKVITGGSPAAAVRQVVQVMDGEITGRLARIRDAQRCLEKGEGWKSIAAMHGITRARYEAETGAPPRPAFDDILFFVTAPRALRNGSLPVEGPQPRGRLASGASAATSPGKTRRFARDASGWCPARPAREPTTNGMAEAFVRTLKRDYA